MTTPEQEAAPGDSHGAAKAAERRWTLRVLAVFLAIAVAYVASVPGQLYLKPDSMVYLGLARSLARGDGYTFNLEAYGKYPPVFPLMLAAVHGLAGEAARIRVMQTLVALAGVGALAAAYFLVRARAGVRVALAVVVMSAASTWFWAHSSVCLLAEVPYALFSLLALWAAERAIRAGEFSVRRWVLAGVLAAVALLTHGVGVALLPALVCGALFAKARGRSRGQRALAAVLVGTLALACTVGWWAHGRGLSGMSGYSLHVAEKAEELDRTLDKLRLRLREYTAAPLSLSYKRVSGTAGAAAFLLLFLPGLVEGFRRYRSCTEFYLCGHFVVSALLGGQTGHERYVVPVVPLLFYYGCLSVRSVTGWVASELELRRRLRGEDSAVPARWPQWAVAAVMILVVAYGLVYRVRGKRGGRPFSPKERAKKARLLAAWQEAGQWAKENMGEGEKVCAGSGGSWCFAHYFTERHVDAPLTDDITVRQMVAQLVAWNSGFVLADQRPLTRLRLWPTLEARPQCFEELAKFGPLAKDNEYALYLYRVVRPKLQEVHARLEERGEKE